MTQRNVRVRATRRSRLFVTSHFLLSTNTIGVAGQSSTVAMVTDFQSVTGRQLMNATLAGTWLRGLYTQNGAAGLGPVDCYLGGGMYPAGMDDGDFPNLELHEGDWFIHDGRALRYTGSSGSILSPLNASAGGGVDIHSGGQRKVSHAAISPAIVLQIGVAPSAGSVEFNGVLTALWLLPS